MNSNAKILGELSEFISFPTISSDPGSEQNFSRCSAWLQQHLIKIGMPVVKVFATASKPVVYAEYIRDPALKTVLFYGHYDVQPVDPVATWHTPPFKAVIKGDHIYGRGASDDKGQLLIHIKAVERLLHQDKALPVNIKFLIEGAEEIGSVGLKDFIHSHKKMLQCDVAVVSDTKMAALHVPAISYSLRGSLNAEIFIQTSGKDLHSGTFGGCVPNAALILSEFIGQLHKKDNSIAIPGFYDDVEMISVEERRFIQANGISDDELLKDAATNHSWGEKTYSMHERSTIRPSLSVTGISSGFQGKGVKNVIPSSASAKLSFRLVSNQRPERVRLLLDDYIKKMIPYPGTRIVYSSFNNPVSVSRNNPYIIAAASAYERVFGNKVKLIRSGGTIGAVDHLQSILKIPVVLMGFAQASDNRHAPDEKMYLPNFFRGIDTSINFMKNISSTNLYFSGVAATGDSPGLNEMSIIAEIFNESY